MNGSIVLKDESYAIQGAVFEVYREIGVGFLESVYQECLEKEFVIRSIPFVSQKDLRVMYKGKLLAQTYKADLLCYNSIIVELKAVKAVDDVHRAQVFNYLRATGLHLGLLVNFGHYPKATIERILV